VPGKRLSSIVFLIVLSAIFASCGSNGSPTAPSHTSGTGGAVIIGHVTGTPTTLRKLDAGSTVGTGRDLTIAQTASTTLTVSISGTNISTTVDGNGMFELTGVPPGDVTLKFSGAGVNASITLTGVPASSQISITVSLNGNSARLDSERRDDDEDDHENDDEGDLEGTVSNRSGTCPTLTFTVQATTVKTNSATKFDGGQCAGVVNGVKVEVEGTRQTDGTLVAQDVEIK
jgi:Domain of unknown function (DUF5666)